MLDYSQLFWCLKKNSLTLIFLHCGYVYFWEVWMKYLAILHTELIKFKLIYQYSRRWTHSNIMKISIISHRANHEEKALPSTIWAGMLLGCQLATAYGDIAAFSVCFSTDWYNKPRLHKAKGFLTAHWHKIVVPKYSFKSHYALSSQWSMDNKSASCKLLGGVLLPC